MAADEPSDLLATRPDSPDRIDTDLRPGKNALVVRERDGSVKVEPRQ